MGDIRKRGGRSGLQGAVTGVPPPHRKASYTFALSGSCYEEISVSSNFLDSKGIWTIK